MKLHIINLKVILSTVLCLAVLGALLTPALPASAGTGYSPITVWLGTGSVTVSATDYAALLATYNVTITGTYGTHSFSYTGVPVYRIMEFAFPAVSSLSSYSVLTADSTDYKVIYGPSVMDNITVKGNNNLIIATGGTLDGAAGTNFPRSACSTFTAGNRFNNNVATMKLQYAIQATTPVNGTITPASGWYSGSNNPWQNSTPPALGVDYNTNQTFNVTPASGYQVASITTDAGAQTPAASYIFSNVIDNHTIAATFTPVSVTTYNITTSTDGHGTVIANPATVNSGGSSTITITPNQGYSIATVTDNGTDVTGLVSGGIYTLNNVVANHNISVTFTTSWTLQIINAGSTYNMTQSEFESMPSVTFNVTDMHGTHSWTGVPIWKLVAKNDSDGNPNAFNENLATFNYSVKAVSTGSSPYIRCIGPTASGTAIAHNDNVIIANKMDGAQLPSDSAPLKVVGTDLISSRFVSQLASIELVYTINIATTTNGTITPVGNTADKDGIVGVSFDANQTFTITPDTGYRISSLTVDGVAVDLAFSYSFINVTSNHTLSATFIAGTQDWPLQIVGFSTANLTKSDFEDIAAAHPSNVYASFDKSGNPDGYQWKGVALWRLIGLVDGSGGTVANPTTFNSALVGSYSIKLTAADGFNKTIASPYEGFSFQSLTENLSVANKVMLPGTTAWVNLPLVKPGDTKLLYPLIDTGSGITTGNLRVSALVKIELLNLPTTFNITTLTDGHGTVIANPTTVNSGGSSTITITPVQGYQIATVTDNGTNVTGLVSGNTYTITNIMANHAVSVTFASIPLVNVSVSPVSLTVNAGATFNLTLAINTNTASRGWQANVNFDHAKLIANSVSEGGFLKDWAQAHGDQTTQGVAPTIDNSGGHITSINYAIMGTADLGGPSGSGTLCTISFTARQAVTGSVAITLSGVVVSDVNGTTVPGITITPGTVTINALPVNVVQLASGWNTFSTPFSLDKNHNNLGTILTAGIYDLAYSFNTQTQLWETITSSYTLVPCNAIYLHMTSASTVNLTINTDPTPPPSRSLLAGWNLISLANLEAMKASDALISIEVVTGGGTGYVQVISPSLGNQTGWTYIKGKPISDTGTNGWMQTKLGYWAFMINGGTLAGFTTTP